jgi:23S rRNA (pseudouridine1915-N3)-methyltransferase
MTATRLRIVWIGRTKSVPIAQWTEEYLRRIGRFGRIEAEELSERQGEAALLHRAEGSRLILLDPAGRKVDSEGFARWLASAFERDSREMIFAIGGAKGFSAAARQAATERLALSEMTYSHELARAMLLEQLFRALAIIHHHPYPR